jgi:hypothetical protein
MGASPRQAGSRPRPGSANVPSRHDAAAPCGASSVFYVTWRAAPATVFSSNNTFGFRNSKNSTSFENKNYLV